MRVEFGATELRPETRILGGIFGFDVLTVVQSALCIYRE